MKNIIVAAVIVMVIWIIVKVTFHDGVYALDRGEYVVNPEAVALYEKIIKDGDFNLDVFDLNEMDETQFEAFLLSFQKCRFKDEMSFLFDEDCKPASVLTDATYVIDDARLAAMGRSLLHHPSESVRFITFSIFAEDDVYLNRPTDIFNAANAMKEGRIDYYLMYLMENPDILMGEENTDKEFPWAEYSELDNFYSRCELSDNPAVKIQAEQYGKTPEELAESIKETDESYREAFHDRKCYTKKDLITKGLLLARCPVDENFLFSDDCRGMKNFRFSGLSLCGIDNVDKMEEELIKMAESKDPQTRYYGFVYANDDKLMSLLMTETDATALGLYIQYYLDQEKLESLDEDELKALEMLKSHHDERIRKLATTVWDRLHEEDAVEESTN